MSNEELFAEITDIIKENTNSEVDFGVDDNLLQNGTIDSFGILQIFLGLQSRLGANIEIEDITEETFSSVRSIGELIQSRA